MKKLALLLIVLLAAAATAEAQTVTITTLTDLGPGLVPNAINNNGVVVGQNASGQAFVYQGETMTPLGTLGGTQSAATDVNDSGVVVGWANLTGGTQHGFKYTTATGIVDLNPGSTYSFAAEAVNAPGGIVGWVNNGTQSRSVYWMTNGTTDYLFGSTNSQALGINDSGQIVGVGLNSSSIPDVGYYWDGFGPGGWTTTYIGYYPFAGINHNGLTAGCGREVAEYLQIGAVDSTPVGKLSISDLLASSNGLDDNSNYIVGYSDAKGFLYDFLHHSLYNMNDFIPPASTFTELNAINDINTNGQFVGVGLVGSVPHGFVGQVAITPEPSTLALLAFGALAAAGASALRCFRRRRAISA